MKFGPMSLLIKLSIVLTVANKSGSGQMVTICRIARDYMICTPPRVELPSIIR